MGLSDDLLTCLALERQAYALYGRWSGSVGRDSRLYEILSRLADQSDRHRASLWDLALRHDVTPPPRFELAGEADAPYVELLKFTLRRSIEALSSLAFDLDGYQRDLVERMRNEDAAQLRQLLILSPEPRLTADREQRMPNLELLSSEPRWRPGIE